MPGGRPQFPGKEQLFKDLIEWAKQPDSINLCAFCCSREPPLAPTLLIRWSKENEEFSRSYDAAKAFIGARREQLLNSNKLHVKAYDLNATTYDPFLRDERRAQAEFEAELAKQKNDPATTQEISAALEAVLDQVSQLQSNSSKVDIKINSDK